MYCLNTSGKMDLVIMKVQKVSLGGYRYTWLVLSDDYLPIEPISAYLKYLTNIEKPNNTIRTYANHLKLYWEFLNEHNINWSNVSLEELSGFINWLRFQHSNIISTINNDNLAQRKTSTVNCILGSLSSFYRYQKRLGKTSTQLTEFTHNVNGTVSNYKSLLHHIYKGKPIQRRLLKLRQHKEIIKTLTSEQVDMVVL